MILVENGKYLDMRMMLIAACLLLIACIGPKKFYIEHLSVDPRNASEAAQDLARYYARLEQRLILRGLLRTMGDGPGTPFSNENLFRDFLNLAFFG